jgi:hypothetical protein
MITIIWNSCNMQAKKVNKWFSMRKNTSHRPNQQAVAASDAQCGNQRMLAGCSLVLLLMIDRCKKLAPQCKGGLVPSGRVDSDYNFFSR